MQQLNNKRISSRSLSNETILVSFQNLDEINQKSLQTLRINRSTTIQDVKLAISNNLEEYEYIELYQEKNQPLIGNVTELILNKIKQANTRVIYYKVVKRSRSQPQNNNNDQKNSVCEPLTQKQTKLLKTIKSIKSPQSNQIQLPCFSNNKRNILQYQQEITSLKNTLQQLQIQNADLEKQKQELIQEITLNKKLIFKNDLHFQNIEQDNKLLREQNQNLSGQLVQLKENFSNLQNLNKENREIKDELKQIKLFSEQILKEKDELQKQAQLHIIDQGKFNNLQQENIRLIQIINDNKEKLNLNSQNQIDKLQIRQVNFGTVFLNFEQQKNKQILKQTPKLKKSVSFNLDQPYQNFKNQCGHTIQMQELEYIVYQSYLNKERALCNQCTQPLKQKLCLQVQFSGQTYQNNQNKYDLLNLTNFIKQNISNNSKLLAKCKNKYCIFFCIWEQKQNEQKIKQKNSFCPICKEQSVINPFLSDQVQQELIEEL